MEQMNQKARQPGFMHASLLQFFAEGVDPFLRVKATAEVELNKANKKHTAIIDEVEASIKTAEETANNSYGWAHRPGDPEGGIPAWDLTQNVPADVYTHPHYYSDMSEPSNQEAHRILGRIRNNPEAKVHIYRSLPAEEAHHGIKPGDWVSISRDYARQHGKQEDPKDDWPVIRATVKAKDLFTDADDFRELGFWGEKPVVHGIHFKGGKNQEVSVRSDGSIRAVQRRNQTQASVVDFFHQAADNDLLQHFGSEEDPFLTMKKQEEAKLRAGSNGKPLRSGPEWDQYIETMRKAPHPKNVEYKFYHDKTFLGTPPGTHAVIAHHDGKEVGHLYWADDNQAEYPDDTDDTSNEPDNPHIYPGDIYHIQVHAPYQRHGIATTILQKAHEAYASGEATTKPVHVDDLSKDAEAWINSLPTHLSLLQHFGSEEDPFLTVKKQEDARLQNAIDKHEDEKEKSTSPNASEKLQQKIHEANETYKENMSNAPHPQNVEYRWMEARGGYGHQITAHHNGEQIGRMEWTPQKDRHQYTGNHFPGEIQWIEVDEPYQSHGIATTMLTKAHEAYQAGLADSKPQHSDIKTDEGQAWHDHLVKTLHPHASKNATVLNDKRPNQRLFAPTLTNLDPRLFDGERLRPEIRETIMNRIAAHWDENYKNWREWSRVYLAGSAVSHWWADYNAVSHAGEPGLDYHLNDDLDTLIGIEYGGLLENHPEFLGVPARVISAELNKGLRENCNLNDIFFEVPSAEVPEWEWADTPQNGKVKVGPWSATFYVNPNSYDIRVIKPYAAYDLTNDEWAVKPVEAAEGHNFTPTEWYYFEGVAAEIMATLQLPEPARSNKAKHLWEFIHTNRNKAFRPDGQGVFDYRNVVEKYLDQLGLWQPLVNARFGVNKKEGVLLYGHEKIKQRYVEEGSYFYGAKNKNRKNAPQPGDGIAGSPSGSPSDDSILGDQEKTQPVINSHPKLSKDFGKMSIGDKKRANETIEKIANGDVEGLDTHPIRYGAMSKQKPYWLSTPFGRGMRVVHRKEKDNSLTILYAGKHEYDEVVRRATGVQNV
jgi:GNAT superfamily N-acetyltransferase